MKHTVLIVEDDQSIRQGVELTLLKEGYNVLTAPSAEDAQRVLDASRVDLMILDLMLPGQTGQPVGAQAYPSSQDKVIILFMLLLASLFVVSL